MLDDQAKQIGKPLLKRSDGVTPSERYLKKLCDKTFLSLWSYPGVFRDQGQTQSQRLGKEVCDLLVVFEDDIIIFSDKDCAFPNTGNIIRNYTGTGVRESERVTVDVLGDLLIWKSVI